jgi:hypothetical protein
MLASVTIRGNVIHRRDTRIYFQYCSPLSGINDPSREISFSILEKESQEIENAGCNRQPPESALTR